MANEPGERPQTYSSPAIRARRSRILEETRAIIAEQGVSGLNMNEIGKRAGVAKRTLYNAFQTRERVIAAAISEYFEEYVSRIPHDSPSGTLAHNLKRMISVVKRNRKIRNYIRAIMALYFSSDVDHDVWLAMHSMAAKSNLQWIRSIESAKQLQPWVKAEQLADDIVRFEYATINDWAQGRITDDDIVPRLVTGYLSHMLGVTKGAARKEIEQLLTQIAEQGADAPIFGQQGKQSIAA